MLKVAFFGSSKERDIGNYSSDVGKILQCLFEIDKEIVILTGGYQGLMKTVSKIGKEESKKNKNSKKNTFIQGILYDGYLNDPQNSEENYIINKPNDLNDTILSVSSLGNRTQILIDLADIIIALPGHSGTLTEILQTIEHLKYGSSYNYDNDFKKLFLHTIWWPKIEKLCELGLVDKDIKSNLRTFNFNKRSGVDEFKHRILTLYEVLNKKEKIVPDLESFEFEMSENDYGNLYEFETSKIIKYEPPTQLSKKKEKYTLDINIKPTDVRLLEEDKLKLSNFINRVNEVIKGSYISFHPPTSDSESYFLGLDIVIKDIEANKILSLETLGTPKYCRILQLFLNTYGSILLQDNMGFLDSDEPLISHIDTLDFSNREYTKELFYYDHLSTLTSSTNQLKPTIDDWINFLSGKDLLSEEKYGKTLIWSNKSILRKKYIVSGFLLLNIYLPKNFIEISRILDEYLLREVTDEVVDKIYNPELKRQATKAAFAVLNARTMSHNTGSHILASDLTKEDPIKLNIFRNYIRQRMLYNSDITAALPSFDVSYSLEDIKKHFENVDVVRKYISGYENREFGELIFECEDDKKIMVSLSNGILGMQAFFVILENIIRNYFKHSSDTLDNLIETIAESTIYDYTINKLDGGNKEFVFKPRKISNLIKKLDIKLSVENVSSHFVRLTLKDGSIIKDDNQIQIIQDYINKEILDKKSLKLRANGLGFLEMKGAACYLNSLPLEEIDNAEIDLYDNDKKEKVYSVSKDASGRLQHHFYLRKPKEILILGDTINATNEQLNSIGIFIKNNIDAKNNERHKFLIITDSKIFEQVKNNIASLPHRIFLCEDTNIDDDEYPTLSIVDLDNIKRSKTIDEAINILYPKWIDHLVARKGIKKDKIKIYTGIPFQNEILNGNNKSGLPPIEGIDKNFIIYFDNHNEFATQTQSAKYYEGLEGLNSFKYLISNYREQSKCFRDEIIEFATTKIVFIDERIQSRYENALENENLRRQNIIVPLRQKEFDLHDDNYDDKLKDKMFLWINNVRNAGEIDYLVIHLGIIEKFLGNSNTDKNQQCVNNWLNEKLNNWHNIKRIVITSERGTPENIPDGICFVHFSNLNFNIIEVPSKYSLVKILYSSRKRATL